MLLGPDGCARLAAARVAVFGLGGVGSFAVEALARAGIGELRVVDHDVVNPTNLNRQLFGLHSTLGIPKVEAARARILDIHPACHVDARLAFIHNETVAELLLPRTDLVIDAIDSLNAKTALLQACVEAGIPVISSMGAGGRVDGGALQVGDLAETRLCPLATKLRQRLRRRGIEGGIRCVYSLEPRRASLPPQAQDVDAHVGAGRRRTPVGTISFLPAMFGLRAAQEAILLVLGESVGRSND
jgi:tRNA A37 threonylcarbamoyladenosine dehydratase